MSQAKELRQKLKGEAPEKNTSKFDKCIFSSHEYNQIRLNAIE